MQKLVPSQGMEVADPECEESDPEEGGWQIKEVVRQKGADGEEEVKNKEEEDEDKGGEQSDIEEEQEEVSVDEEDWKTCSEGEEEAEGGTAGSSDASFHNSSRLLRKDELLEMFKAVHNGSRVKEGQLTVGLVSKRTIYLSV